MLRKFRNRRQDPAAPIGSGTRHVAVKSAHRARGSYQVRRMSGYFHCGCPVDIEALAHQIEMGINPAEDTRCDTHGDLIRYTISESGIMHNVAVVEQQEG